MTSIVTNPRERTRFLRFAVVGAIGAIVDFGVMNLLNNVFGFTLVFSGTISFISAILSNFFWNRYWTYPDSRSKHLIRQLIEFGMINAIGLVIRIPILAYLEPRIIRFLGMLRFNLPFMSKDTAGANITLAIAVIIVMFWNFFANRYWTYGDVD